MNLVVRSGSRRTRWRTCFSSKILCKSIARRVVLGLKEVEAYVLMYNKSLKLREKKTHTRVNASVEGNRESLPKGIHKSNEEQAKLTDVSCLFFLWSGSSVGRARD